jgi:hypothetical protein
MVIGPISLYTSYNQSITWNLEYQSKHDQGGDLLITNMVTLYISTKFETKQNEQLQ